MISSTIFFSIVNVTLNKKLMIIYFKFNVTFIIAWYL